MDAESPLALLLVGQPTLARQLRMGVFAALDQRIATRYQIAPMDLGESVDYLRHHLALVGRSDPLVAEDAIARLHKASLGLGPGRRRLCKEGGRGAHPATDEHQRQPEHGMVEMIGTPTISTTRGPHTRSGVLTDGTTLDTGTTLINYRRRHLAPPIHPHPIQPIHGQRIPPPTLGAQWSSERSDPTSTTHNPEELRHAILKVTLNLSERQNWRPCPISIRTLRSGSKNI
jgi:hypothetical protein